MSLSRLPKDVLVALALDLDLEYVISLCRTSKEFNEKICQNNYFWVNKLLTEYGVQEGLKDAKEEYLSLNILLKKYPDKVLVIGIDTENFKLVKAAIEAGADPMYKIGQNYPIIKAILFDDNSILKYLLDKIDWSRQSIILSMRNYIDYFDSPSHTKSERCKMFINFYSIYLPYISKYTDATYKRFWTVAGDKLEEEHEREYELNRDCVTDEFYNKWIGFYKELAK